MFRLQPQAMLDLAETLEAVISQVILSAFQSAWEMIPPLEKPALKHTRGREASLSDPTRDKKAINMFKSVKPKLTL